MCGMQVRAMSASLALDAAREVRAMLTCPTRAEPGSHLTGALCPRIAPSPMMTRCAISKFLGTNLTAFVTLGRVNIASAELRKEKTARVLNGLGMSFFRSMDTRVSNVEEILEVF